jgi:hypothetical protein
LLRSDLNDSKWYEKESFISYRGNR